MATQSEILKARRRSGDVKDTLLGAGTLGGAALGISSKAFSKVMPFLNEYIPENLAIKGINKVFPALGRFLKAGERQGLTPKSGLDFIKNEVSKQQQKDSIYSLAAKGTTKNATTQGKNVIEKFSPKLHKFLEDRIKNGIAPEKAAVAAFSGKAKKQFSTIISEIERDQKDIWEDIVERIYGSPKTDQATGSAPSSDNADNFYNQIFTALKNGEPNINGVKVPILDAVRPSFQRGQIRSPQDIKNFAQYWSQAQQIPQSQGQRSQQVGPGQQKMLEILSRIQQRLGG